MTQNDRRIRPDPDPPIPRFDPRKQLFAGSDIRYADLGEGEKDGMGTWEGKKDTNRWELGGRDYRGV